MVITLTQDDATALAHQLARAIQIAYGRPGVHAPLLLLDFAAEISRSARFRASPQVRPGAGTDQFRSGPSPAVSEQQPEWLTVKEAAKLAEVSEGFMRRCCRARDVEASRDHRSAWLVDASSLRAWIGRRRKELDRKAA